MRGSTVIHSPLFSLTFSLTLFYIFPERSAQRRRVYLPIPDPASSYHRIRLPSVGTHVFKQASSSRTALDISSISIYQCVFSLPSSLTLCVRFSLSRRLGTCARGPAVHPVP